MASGCALEQYGSRNTASIKGREKKIFSCITTSQNFLSQTFEKKMMLMILSAWKLKHKENCSIWSTQVQNIDSPVW